MKYSGELLIDMEFGGHAPIKNNPECNVIEVPKQKALGKNITIVLLTLE